MPVSTRIEPLDRDIALIIDQDLSPERQSRVLAQYAREQIDEAQRANASALGRVPAPEVTVDGRRGASIESVRPDGVVVAEFSLVNDVLAWIGEQLVLASPRRSGRYIRSHVLYVDGVAVDAGGIASEEYAFVSALPYSRKIELGLSQQAPAGVYQSVAAVAQRHFGNIARIAFTYRAVIEGRAVVQNLAASSGQPWWLGGAEARAATGEFEKMLGRTAHNKRELRFPAITVRVA